MKNLAYLRLLFLAFVAGLLLMPSCTSLTTPAGNLKNWAWMYINRDFPQSDWNAQLELMKASGIDGILLLLNAELDEEYEQIARLIKAHELEIQVWIPVVNPHGDDGIETEHPDWYQISREGKSCITDPPYIPSYKWLCPNNPEAREYIINEMDHLASLDYLDGIHLDYIRFPDVILPVGIQPKYDLVQDQEFAEFDFCYCEHCRDQFKTLTGKDPLELENPSADQEWIQFRYASITNLVNQIAERVHGHGKKLSAAVFPTPELAKKLVRQDWTNWNLDEVMPMMYHQYYNEPIAWIEEASKQGVSALSPEIPLYSGLFINEIKPSEFDDVVLHADAGGAQGICLFNANGMSKKQWKALSHVLH